MEPSQSNRTGQKTIIINGVPEPARKRNGVESVIKIDAKSETLFLNQRFKIKIKSNPSNNPIMMLGNLMANGVRPRMEMDTFWSRRYGKLIRSPLKAASGSSS